MKKTIIFDLDGTLANIDVRRDISLKPNGKLNWEIFASPDSILNFDTPNDPVIKMAQMFHNDGFKIVIFSGRNDRGFDAFLFNPLSSGKPEFDNVDIIDIYQEVKWYFPKIKSGQILCVPLENKPKPQCAYFVKDISRQCELIDYSAVW